MLKETPPSAAPAGTAETAVNAIAAPPATNALPMALLVLKCPPFHLCPLWCSAVDQRTGGRGARLCARRQRFDHRARFRQEAQSDYSLSPTTHHPVVPLTGAARSLGGRLPRGLRGRCTRSAPR
ncbi:hypothetical protein SAM9427_13510 [Streptomyces sp. ETH9427]|nr:hypothetical protein SAM9427_13510 [Streptomyces sp. ETH9427]